MKNKIPIPDNPDSVVSHMENFIKIVELLRQDCPWDHEQSHKSLSHLLIEEAYEAVDAINKGDMNELAKELGDILLHIVMHSIIASETNEFSFIDVIKSISNKMIYRHPHVFEIDGNDTGSEINTSEQVLDNWEKRKMKEGRTSVLEGVPADLPSLLRAERIQEKAARVGFDWINKQDVWAKVHEELGELKEEIDTIDSAFITTFDAFSLYVVKKYHTKLNNTSHIQICDEVLYTYGNVEIKDMFEKIILKYRIITINEIRKIINEEYEIEVSNSRIRNYITDMDFYYNEILDKVYADKNDYYEEVYDE